MLSRVEKPEVLRFYKIADFNTLEEFLGQIARKKGLLKSGGTGNLEQAARMVIRDYLSGKIKYFTIPPTVLDEDEDDIDMDWLNVLLLKS